MSISNPDHAAPGEILKDNPGWLDEAVTTAEAGRTMDIPACTLHTWCSRGSGPPFLKLGSKFVRCQRRTLFEWMAARRRLITKMGMIRVARAAKWPAKLLSFLSQAEPLQGCR